MDLISFGDSIPEGEYRLHSAFANAINFRRGRIVVSLVPPRAGAGPLNLVVRQLPPGGARRLRASRFYFYVDENRLRKAPEALYSSEVPAAPADPEKVQIHAASLAGSLVRRAPAKSLAFFFDPSLEKNFSRTFDRLLLARFKKAAACFKSGKYSAGVKIIRGLGFGLTPAGDDFISGLLAGYNYALAALRIDTRRQLEEVFEHAEGGNLLSNAFMRASYEGKVNAKVRRLLCALTNGPVKEIDPAAAEVMDCGHTSGADFCAGLLFAVRDSLGEYYHPDGDENDQNRN